MLTVTKRRKIHKIPVWGDFMTGYLGRRSRRTDKLRTVLLSALFLSLILILFVFCFVEFRISPLISDAAKSRARIFASEAINHAVSSSIGDASLVRITSSAEGVAGIETDIAALSSVRTSAVETLNKLMNDPKSMIFSVPLGSLTGSAVLMGRGIPITIRLVPIGDITADIRTEFIESGINQTLHKISMRVRVSVNVIAAGEIIKLELAADVTLAETVIVGKVPDAYTAINRFEIDEEEENDLNDYAASIP